MRKDAKAPLFASNSHGSRGSVYEEGMEMLIGSVIIYIFAELRDMIREGAVEDLSLADLEPPLTASKTLQVIQAHKEALKIRAKDHEYLESRLLALKHAYEGAVQQEEERQPKESMLSPSFLLDLVFCGGLAKTINNMAGRETPKSIPVPTEAQQNAIVLKRFVDHNSKEEIVHGVVVNPNKKRITIIFRGSVTNKDFLQDAKCAQLRIDNPVLNVVQGSPTEEEMPSKIRIHTGFYEYLFYQSKDSSKTRLQEILEDTKQLLRENPGYSLYMTGHSLGGALSTLCGFFAACDDELVQLTAHQRIVVYSVASPFCGNWKFRHAFQELERQRRLQHLRIANLEDMVTLMPFAVPKATFLSPALSMLAGAGNLYKHVGIKVQLKKTEQNGKQVVEHSIHYPRENQSDCDEEFAKEVQDVMEQGKSLVRALYYLVKSEFSTVEKYHSCDEYEERFETCQAALGTRTLDDLYNDPSIVGKLFADNHKLTPLPKSGITRAFRALSVLTKTNSQKTNKPAEADDEEQMTLQEAALASPQ